MTKLSRYTQFCVLSIWTPRWHDKKVLLNAFTLDRTTCDYVKVKFVGEPGKEPTPSMKKLMAHDWVITRRRARLCAKTTNGRIPVYAVPLEDLEELELVNNNLEEVI